MGLKTLLGAKIKELRKKNNYSQEYFAELIELNPRQVVRIENGESFPTAENLEKIAKIFKIKPQELFVNDCYTPEDNLRELIITKLQTLKGDKLRALYMIANNL